LLLLPLTGWLFITKEGYRECGLDQKVRVRMRVSTSDLIFDSEEQYFTDGVSGVDFYQQLGFIALGLLLTISV
jgi:hypothetical protein